jgi:hypothetical protein
MNLLGGEAWEACLNRAIYEPISSFFFYVFCSMVTFFLGRKSSEQLSYLCVIFSLIAFLKKAKCWKATPCMFEEGCCLLLILANGDIDGCLTRRAWHTPCFACHVPRTTIVDHVLQCTSSCTPHSLLMLAFDRRNRHSSLLTDLR